MRLITATGKSPEKLIRMLINTVSCGGNLLMNVGPTGRGNFDERASTALDVYRDWMKFHSRSIYGCTKSEYNPPSDIRYTQNGKRLYVHIFSWPFKQLVLPGLAEKIEYIQLLNDASEIMFRDQERSSDSENISSNGNCVVVNLPVIKPDVLVPVLEVFLK